MKLFTSVKMQCNKSLNDLFKILLLTTVTTLALHAQPAYNEQILGSSGGDAVAMDKDWAVVGDIANNKAHVYKLDYSKMQNDPTNMWVEQNFLSASKQGRFGASVAVHGDKMIVGAPDVETWRMEANTITIPATHTNPVFTTITLQRTYEQPPLIFALASSDGGQPSAVKIKNRTNNSFEIVHAEPALQDGTHNAMTISYFAIERGDHVLPDGTRIFAGEITTKLTRYKNSLSNPGDVKGWENISFSVPFSAQPMALAQIQTMNNEVNNVPSTYSDPWLTAAIQNVGTNSVGLSLERSEVLTTTAVTQDETIAYLVMDVATGTFSDINNNPINFESIYSDESIKGWDNGCYTTDFTQTFTAVPLVVATKDTLIGGDGGWLRSCSLTNLAIGLTVDEDQYTDTERAHTTERAGILALSGIFTATFKQGEAYLYQYNTTTTDWDLKETIEPTQFSDDMKFGSAVGIHTNNDGTAEIVVGAPNALDLSTERGKVFTYSWDGSTMTPHTTLAGNSVHSIKFGSSLDIKGDYLIVGAPDEESTATNDFVGGAYTYKFDGTSWVTHPNNANFEIKRNITNEKLGTSVSIEDNHLMVATAPSSSAGNHLYRLNSNTDIWDELVHFYQNDEAHGTDIDNNISMQGINTDVLRMYVNDINHSKYGSYLDMTITTSTTTNALDSIGLYKEQAIVSDPGNSRANAIDIPCGIRPTELISNVWSIISAPCGDGTVSIGQLFVGQLGTYGDAGDWVMYKQDTNFNGKQSSYVLMDQNEPMEIGKGYWIISANDRLVLVNASQVSTRTPLTRIGNTTDVVPAFYDAPLPPLASGVEQKIIMGNAFPRAFKLKHLEAFGGSAVGWPNSIFHATVYVYDSTDPDGTGQPYRAVTTTGTPGISDEIKPYQGFWIKDLGAVTTTSLKLGIPFER